MVDNATMIEAIIIAAGALISIQIPTLKIDSNITHVKASIDHMVENDKIQDERIRIHGKELDEIVKQIERHEVRVTTLERYHHN